MSKIRDGDPDLDWNWKSITTYLDRFDDKTMVNVAMLVPHGTVRMAVMGMASHQPAPDELARMKEITVQSLREGAIGLSTGLTYAPGMFATDEEIVALCEVIRPYNGFYIPHHRNYGMEALQGYADSLEIGRRAGVPVHLTHCHFGFPVNKGRVSELLALIDEYRGGGTGVTLDTYPYLAGKTYLHANLPSRIQEGGNEAILTRLRSPDVRRRFDTKHSKMLC